MRISVVAAVLLVAVLVAGCSPGSKPLVRVGNRVVTADEFVEIARIGAAQYSNDPAVAKDSLVQDLLRRELLLQSAFARGLDRTELARRYRRKLEDQSLGEAISRELAPSDIRVSEQELQAFYATRNVEGHVGLVFSTDANAIRTASADLARGLTFQETSDRYSIPGAIPPGGDVGWVTPGGLMAPLDDLIRTLPLGEVAGPLETPQGWFLMRVTERRPVSRQMPFEMQRPGLADMLRQRKQRSTTARAVAVLREEYRVRLEPGGSQVLFGRLNTGVRLPQQEATVLATYLDEHLKPQTYTIADVMQDLDHGDGQRPNASMLPSLEAYIENRCVQLVLLAEARRRKLDQEPAIRRLVDKKFNDYLLESVYAEVAGAAPAPTEEDAYSVWEQNRNSFIRLDSVHLLHITLADPAKANLIAQHGGHAGTLREAAKMADPSLTVTEETIRYPTADSLWDVLQAAFMQMQPNEWRGPIEAPGGLMLLQVLDKVQGAQDWDQLPPALKENLRNYAAEMGRQRRVLGYADSLRVAMHPFVDVALLKRLPWPSPAPSAPLAPPS